MSISRKRAKTNIEVDSKVYNALKKSVEDINGILGILTQIATVLEDTDPDISEALRKQVTRFEKRMDGYQLILDNSVNDL